MKTCIVCKKDQPTTEFYAHAQMADGLFGKCKTCCKEQANALRIKKLQDPNWVTKERQRCRLKAEKYRQSGVVFKTSNVVKHAWRKRNRVKSRAHCAAVRAVRNGKIERKTICEKCGVEGKLHKHHPDYSQPLKVEWICPKCHGLEHRKFA